MRKYYMKNSYKWFKVVKEYQENIDETWYTLLSQEDDSWLGELQLYRNKWILESGKEIFWYWDCLQDVVDILKELNKIE